MSNPNAQKIVEDVAERAHQMPKNSALLYKNKTPKDAFASHYRGLVRLENGQSFWVGCWVRRLGQERVLEIRLIPKK